MASKISAEPTPAGIEAVRKFIHANPRIAREAIARMFADNEKDKNDLLHDFKLWARPEQIVDIPADMDTLLLLCGRGFGKTWYVSNKAIDLALSDPNSRIALWAADYGSLKKVNFLGESGIISQINPNLDYEFNKSDLILKFANGSQITGYSCEALERSRGSQSSHSVVDELAAWQYAEEGLEAAKLINRLGKNPLMYIATTPRPTAIIKSLCANPYVYTVKGTTHDNYFLTPKYSESLKRELTDRMFRQECLAEILDDNPYALWRMTDIEACRMHNLPQLRRIVVGVDPAVSSNELSDETGIVVCGIGYDDRVYILDDCSVTSATPDQWAQAVVDAYNKWEADAVIAEVNQGGDMVETVILQKSRNLRVIKVRATKGKEVRAEPVAAIYERRECSHIGRFDKLEQQMTEWDPVNSKKSPDRMDALVWAVSELTGICQESYGAFRPSGRR